MSVAASRQSLGKCGGGAEVEGFLLSLLLLSPPRPVGKHAGTRVKVAMRADSGGKASLPPLPADLQPPVCLHQEPLGWRGCFRHVRLAFQAGIRRRVGGCPSREGGETQLGGRRALEDAHDRDPPTPPKG